LSCSSCPCGPDASPVARPPVDARRARVDEQV
jgi:hypothetical protein